MDCSRQNNDRGAILIGALAVVIGLTLIFAAALTFVTARYSEHIRARNSLIARRLANAGLNHMLARLESDLKFDDSVFIQAPNNGSFSVSARPWGPYLLLVSHGRYANCEVTASGKVGSLPPSVCSGALISYDSRYPVVVAGKSMINGDVYAGPLGVQRGEVRGERPHHDHFHHGSTLVLADSLPFPKIDSELTVLYLDGLESELGRMESVVPGSASLNDDLLRRLGQRGSIRVEDDLLVENVNFSHAGAPLLMAAGKDIIISGLTRLSGLMEISAECSITLTDSAIVSGVLLTADTIILRGAATFSGIALARGYLAVEGQATVKYPSGLVAYNDGDEPSLIEINTATLVEGIIYAASTETSERTSPNLKIEKQTNISGVVISDSRATLSGRISGLAIARQFYLSLPPTDYINWVQDIRVDRDAIGYGAVLPLLARDAKPPQLGIFERSFSL